MVVVFSNFIISTYGRGCFVDPKIQVVRIPNEQQWILLREAKRNCTYDQLTKWTNTSHKGLMCDSTFDDVMCWPPTAAGTTAAQYCPSYISNFNVTGNIQRYNRNKSYRQVKVDKHLCMPVYNFMLAYEEKMNSFEMTSNTLFCELEILLLFVEKQLSTFFLIDIIYKQNQIYHACLFPFICTNIFAAYTRKVHIT